MSLVRLLEAIRRMLRALAEPTHSSAWEAFQRIASLAWEFVITAFLHGRRPNVPAYAVCVECKRRGTPCVMVARGVACLGPVTNAGCGAICPAYARGCYGCFGPKEQPNVDSLGRWWVGRLGVDQPALDRALATFNVEAFRRQT